MREIDADLYLLHHMYDKHKYETTYFAELVEELEGVMTKTQVVFALDTIGQWGFLEWEYGETKPGWAGRLYRLDPKYATEYLFESKPIDLSECKVRGSLGKVKSDD